MSFSAGARLGPYEVICHIGGGGMGEVYKARDTRLGRLVALKTLALPTEATPQQRHRFELEARAISQVSHPNICALYDFAEYDGLSFLVMELLDGETLEARLELGRLPVERALAIAAQVADALDAAHRRGLTHRDLKPANVMVTRGGVKLLDFGLAKLSDFEVAAEAGTASLHLTDDGRVLGTLPYMAPEQVEGGDVDTRTDIFALGIVIYEMLTGRRPFEGTSRASVAAAILAHQPLPVSSVLPAVSPSVDRLVRKCLAKDPDERWQTARDLASELRWVADAMAAPVTDAPSPPRLGWGRQAAVGAAVAALITTPLVVWGALAMRGSPVAAPGVLRWVPVTFRAGVVSAARFAPDGETIVYSASWQNQPYELFMTRRGSPGSRALGLSPARLMGVSSSGELAFLKGSRVALNLLLPTLRHAPMLVRVPLTGGAPREVLDQVVAADWTPQAGELAIVRRGELQWPIGTVVYKSPALITHIRISPGGDRLAGFEAGSVVVFDRAGRKTTLLSGLIDPVSLAWSPDGREVWFTAARGSYAGPTMWAVSLAGQERVLIAAPPGLMSIHDVFRDGRMLAGRHSHRVGVTCYVAGAGGPRELAWLDGSMPEAISRDGKAVLIGETLLGGTLGGQRAEAYLRPTNGSDALKLGDGFPEDISPDGRLVLVVVRSAVPPRYMLVPVGPGTPTDLPSPGFVGIGEANFLPDGKGIVFAAVEKGRRGGIYVQDLEGGAARAVSPDGVATDGHVTPDGRFVIGRSGDALALYPIAGGDVRPLPFVTPNDMPLQFRVDGRLFVRRMDSWPPEVDLVDLETGHRQLWKVVFPADPTGVDLIVRIVITPDGASYCHDYVRFQSDLFIVEGAR